MKIGIKGKWIERVEDLLHRLECEVKSTTLELDNLKVQYALEKKKSDGFIRAPIVETKIVLTATVLSEKEDMARALREYIDIYKTMHGRFSEEWNLRPDAMWSSIQPKKKGKTRK